MTCIRKRAPKASSPIVRKVMQANVGKDTAPENLLRSALHSSGLRFRKEVAPLKHLRIKADVTFPGRKICVFVDGCFWHGCPIHFKVPRTNTAWWQEKIQANVERDIRQTNLLQEHGWMVLRLWEHDLIPSKLTEVVTAVRQSWDSRAFERPAAQSGTA